MWYAFFVVAHKMSKFKNSVFPLQEEGVYANEGESSFENCVFQNGKTIIPTLRYHHFSSCHFLAGSIVSFSLPVTNIQFTNCVFNVGCLIDWNQSRPTLALVQCTFKSDTYPVFDGMTAAEIYLVRVLPGNHIAALPTTSGLHIDDRMPPCQHIEPFEKFDIPPNTRIWYYSDIDWKNPLTLRAFETMMWKNHRFNVVLFYWKGDYKESILFDKTRAHPCRRIAIQIVALLSTRLIPGDLIRKELTDFLL